MKKKAMLNSLWITILTVCALASCKTIQNETKENSDISEHTGQDSTNPEKETPNIYLLADGLDVVDGEMFEEVDLPSFGYEIDKKDAIATYWYSKGEDNLGTTMPTALGFYKYNVKVEANDKYNETMKSVEFEIIAARKEVTSLKCVFDGVCYENGNTEVVEILAGRLFEEVCSFETDPVDAKNFIEWWYLEGSSQVKHLEWPTEAMSKEGTLYYRVRETRLYRKSDTKQIKFKVVDTVRETVTRVDISLYGLTLEYANLKDPNGKSKKINSEATAVLVNANQDIDVSFVTVPFGAASEIEWELYGLNESGTDYTVNLGKRIPDLGGLTMQYRLKFRLLHSQNYMDLKECSVGLYLKSGQSTKITVNSVDIFVNGIKRVPKSDYSSSEALSTLNVSFVTDPVDAQSAVEWGIFRKPSNGGDYSENIGKEIPSIEGKYAIKWWISGNDIYADFKEQYIKVKFSLTQKTTPVVTLVNIGLTSSGEAVSAKPMATAGKVAASLAVSFSADPAGAAPLFSWSVYGKPSGGSGYTEDLGTEAPDTHGLPVKYLLKYSLAETEEYNAVSGWVKFTLQTGA